MKQRFGSDSAIPILCMLLLLLTVFSPDALAQATGGSSSIPAFESVAAKVLAIFSSRLVITIAAIAIVAAAVAMYFGYINWKQLVLIVIATVLIPSAYAVATMLYNAGSSVGAG